MMKAIEKAEQISDLIMNERCEAPVQDLFSKGLHQMLVELFDELDDLENRSCETCKHFKLITRNEKYYRRCFF